MRAILLRDTVGPDGLEEAELPEPEPAADEVLIDVRAAGVAFPDLLLTHGRYQHTPELPFVPGVEVAGTVLRAPADSALAPGTRVAAMSGLSGWAERVTAPAALTFPVGAGLSDEQAGGFVMNYHTAWFGLCRRGRLQAGETLLVHGAGGGTGTAAVQVGRAVGARVIAVARGEAKAAAARTAGAEDVVDPGSGWLDAVRELTGGRGADVIFDPVGGERFADTVRALAPEGRLLVVGFAEGTIPEIKVNRLLLRNVDLVGVAWGGFLTVDPTIAGQAAAVLDRMIAAGPVSPIVGATYPLTEAARALRDLEQRRAVGKLVLTL